MPNRQLDPNELILANTLLAEIRARLKALSNDDRELLFAYRRKVFKELTYDERDKPAARRKLKDLKWKEQDGLCAICKKNYPKRTLYSTEQKPSQAIRRKTRASFIKTAMLRTKHLKGTRSSQVGLRSISSNPTYKTKKLNNAPPIPPASNSR